VAATDVCFALRSRRITLIFSDALLMEGFQSVGEFSCQL
jgi:hypothetical protein